MHEAVISEICMRYAGDLVGNLRLSQVKLYPRTF